MEPLKPEHQAQEAATEQPAPMTRTADETPDVVHRYRATRTWHHDKPAIMFIGLQATPGNGPESDDMFTAAATALAKQWGYGTLHVCNLFTNLKKGEKASEKNLVGERNREIILSIGRRCRLVVFCWGDHERIKPEYVNSITGAFANARCFGCTESGQPKSLFDVKDAAQELVKFKPS